MNNDTSSSLINFFILLFAAIIVGIFTGLLKGGLDLLFQGLDLSQTEPRILLIKSFTFSIPITMAIHWFTLRLLTHFLRRPWSYLQFVVFFTFAYFLAVPDLGVALAAAFFERQGWVSQLLMMTLLVPVTIGYGFLVGKVFHNRHAGAS